MNDSDKITIVGIVINASLFIASMVWAWFLNKKTIHATLQAAQPAPKAKARRRVLTRRQRHVIKFLRLIQLVIILGAVSDIGNDVSVFCCATISKLMVVYIVVAALAYTGMVVILIQTHRLKKRAKAGDRRVLEMFGDPPKKKR